MKALQLLYSNKAFCNKKKNWRGKRAFCKL